MVGSGGNAGFIVTLYGCCCCGHYLLLWQAMKLGEEAAERVTETFVKPIKLEFEKANHYTDYITDYISN